MTSIISIYALINPIKNSVFYIGASFYPETRLSQHISECKTGTSKKHQEIQSIIDAGLDVEIEILDNCILTEVSFWEEFYINLFTSYGFILHQKKTSNYSQNHSHRTFETAELKPVLIEKSFYKAIEMLQEYTLKSKREIIEEGIKIMAHRLVYSGSGIFPEIEDYLEYILNKKNTPSD